MPVPTSRQPVPGTTIFDGEQARKGYALNKMCYSFNDAGQPPCLRRRRGRLLRQIRPEPAAARGHSQPQRAAADRRRRQRLLPRQVRRDLRARHAGHRRPADRPDQGSVQGQAFWPRGDRPWRRSSAPSPPRTFPPSAAPSPRACRTTPTGNRSSTAFRRCANGSRRSSPTSSCVVYNDHGLNFFLDKMPTFAVGAAAEYRNADEGWGIPTVPPFRGDPDAVVAPDRVAGRARIST